MDSQNMDTLDDAAQLADFISQHHSLNLYAVINGCSFDNFEQFLFQVEPNPQYSSLFEASIFQEVEKTIPYLVKLDARSLLLQSLVQRQNNWGYLLLSQAGFTAISEHFRQLFHASTDEHETVYFFYYQPCIAFAYNKNASPAQLTRFLGPVEHLIIPNYEINLHPDIISPEYAVFSAENTATVIFNNKIPISPQQLSAFEQVTENNFIVNMRAYLSQQSDTFKNLAVEHQLEFIKHGIKQAKNYKISVLANMENYLELMLTYGMHFDKTQAHWAGKILQDTSLQGNEKIEQLLSCDNAIAQKELL